MKIFDFNIHLPYTCENEVNETVYNEINIKTQQIVRVFKEQVKLLSPQVCACNIMVFNSAFFQNDDSYMFTEILFKEMPDACITLLVDFRIDNVEEYLQRAKENKVAMIKFHSYFQKISTNDYNRALKASKVAETLKMPICIDASFGTTGMYQYNNLELAAAIADNIKKVPVIILHSGGARIFEAMLIAHEKKNVYLETSFSLEYYQGASIEQDFAFAYKKIGAHKVLFGSDAPYVNPNNAIENLLKYLSHNKFSSSEIENIMYGNALNLLHG